MQMHGSWGHRASVGNAVAHQCKERASAGKAVQQNLQAASVTSAPCLSPCSAECVNAWLCCVLPCAWQRQKCVREPLWCAQQSQPFVWLPSAPGGSCRAWLLRAVC